MNDDPVLRPGNPVGPALLAIGRDLLDSGPLDPSNAEVEAIHGFRRRMKRWRAFLRLLEPVVGEKALRLRVEARDLARTLAGARDAQAALDAMADIGGDYEALSPASLNPIRTKIEEMRTSAEASSLNDSARDMLRAALARTADAFEHWPLDEVDFHDIAAGLTENYRRARRAVPEDWSAVTPEALHVLRQRVVAHGYQMELIAPLWPRLSRVWVGETQRLRDRLGKHQDLAVLGALTAPKQLLARWRARIEPVIAARQRDHIEAAMRHAGRLFAEKPQAFGDRIEVMWNSAK
jgi:CHAD domain-containing protein